MPEEPRSRDAPPTAAASEPRPPGKTTPVVVGPTHLPEAAGAFEVNFRGPNGRVQLGSGDWLFETVWRASWSEVVCTLDLPFNLWAGLIKGLRLEEVDAARVDQLRFEWAQLHVDAGDVIIGRNSGGYYLGMVVEEIVRHHGSRAGSWARVRYRILPDRSRDFTLRPPTRRDTLLAALEAAVHSLEEAPVAAEQPRAGIGHNAPPPEAALTSEALESVRETLADLRAAARVDPPDIQVLERGQELLRSVIARLVAWTSDRLGEVQSGFFNQIGAALATLLAVHLALTGKLAAVVEAIGALLPR